MNTETTKKKKFKLKVPHTFVILMIVVLVMSVLSYIVPAGQYDRVEVDGKMVVDAESFHYIDQNPIKPFELFKAIPIAMNESASIIFFIFLVGASFGIVMATGAVQRGIAHLAVKARGKEALVIPIVLFLFSLGGATFGMAEETIAFIPVAILLARSLGYDCMIGVALPTLGAACGFVSGWMNPFTVGVAQGLAELELFSGMWLRLIIWVTMLTLSTIFMSRYAKKVKANPELSAVRDLELAAAKEGEDTAELASEPLSKRDILILLTVVISLGVLVWGVFTHGWYFTEIAALFIIMGLVAGAIGGFGPSRMAEEFVNGASGIVFGALVVGVARIITVVMTQSGIIDTIVYALANFISFMPKSIAAVMMFVVQCIINFFIPSGSGQAMATLPIMIPLGDVLGMTRQTTVLAFQLGDGFSNSIIPTVASVMAALSIGKIPYEKWFKWLAPLMGMWLASGVVFMIIASLINYA